VRRSLLIALIAIAVASSASGDGVTRLTPVDTSELVLDGASNLAPWRCSGRTLDAQMVVAASLAQINHIIDHIEDGNVAVLIADPSKARIPEPSFVLRVPISTLRCGNKIMERDMNHALRADRFPEIEFRFTALHGVVNHDIDEHTYRFIIGGVLTLAGVARNIEVCVVAARLAPQRFRIQAELPLRMTDFGIAPPTALFGVIKSHDDLRVRFDLVLQASEAMP